MMPSPSSEARKPTSKNHGESCVLGAGLSGLALGYLLGERNIDFEVLEKEKECGGLMRTLQEDGFTFDYGGSHIIFSKNMKPLSFMLKLLGGNKVKNRRNTKVLYKGCYVKYPFENGLADLPKQENFECVYAFVQNLITKEQGKLKKPVNMREWFRYTFGNGIAEKYLIPYNEKIWKHPIEDMSLEWVERIPNPPVVDIIKSSIGIETEGYTHQLRFYYPRTGGIQALTKKLEQKIENHVISDFEVKRLRKEDGSWLVSNGKKEKIYEKIVSTIPIQDLIKAMDAPKEVVTAANNLRYNSLITVMVGLNTPKINDFSWLYIPDNHILPHRVSFPSNYSPRVAPEGKSSALAEVTANMGDRTWRMKDEDIAQRVIDELHSLRIISKDDVCFTRIKRSKYAYVITDLNYDENLRTVKSFVNEPGIDLLGRFAEFKYLNMDACVSNAMDYVKNHFRSIKLGA